MGFMAKMRDNTGVVLWILVIAFGVIFMLQDTNVFDIIGQTGNAIAKVNGDEITLDEYNSVVQGQLQRIRQSSPDEIPPQTEELIREQVFDGLVDDRLRRQEMDRLGVTVTPGEIQDLVFGDQPHPAIADIFQGEDGQVDRELLTSYAQDPANAEWWVGVEQFLENERRREKLEKLLEATVRVSEEDIENFYRQQNATVSADYVALRFASVSEDEIDVSDRELRRYYDDHKDDFERKQSWVVEYVALSTNPTASDTADVVADLERVRSRFAEARDDSVFLSRYFSERPYTDVEFRRDELNEQIADSVFSDLTVGRIFGPIESEGMMHLVKLVGTEPAEERSVKARHILKRAAESDAEARATARREIQALRRRIASGESFAELAATESDDAVSGANGGDLGWFGPGAMVEPFETAAFRARRGALVGPVETSFGYHLIEVLDISNVAVKVADMALRIRTTPATLNSIEEELEDLQYFAEEEKNFRQEVDRRELEIQTVEIEEDQQFIPNIGNSRTLQNFLAVARVGSVSEPIELNDKYILAHVVEIKKAGFRPFQEVRAEIEPRVKTEARKEIQLQKLTDALQSSGGDLSAVAAAVGASVQSANNIGVANPIVSGLGREPSFVGTVAGLSQSSVSDPVGGNAAAFVAQRTDSGADLELSAEQKESIRLRLLQERRNQLRTEWIAGLREQADIVDNRRVFLQ